MDDEGRRHVSDGADFAFFAVPLGGRAPSRAPFIRLSDTLQPFDSFSTMARFCGLCVRSFPTARSLSQHRAHYHRRPKPPPPVSTFRRHPLLRGDSPRGGMLLYPTLTCILTGDVCDPDGNNLPADFVQPPPPPPLESWDPFSDRPSFEFAEHIFEQMESSEGDADTLLRIWAAKNAQLGLHDIPPIFDNVQHLHSSIDGIPFGDQQWTQFGLRYQGHVDARSPSWKHKTWIFHCRNALVAAENIIANPEFKDQFDVAPYEETITLPTGGKTRRFSNLMSGQWACKKAVSPSSSRYRSPRH